MARDTLFEAFYKDLGEPGTQLFHPQGRSFTLAPTVGDGAAHSHRRLLVRLPGGWSLPHVADIALELESGLVLYLDVVDGNRPLADLKAAAFDALHLKDRSPRPWSALVFVRLPRAAVSQEQVEALAHAYDLVFGVHEHDVAFGAKFAALRSEVRRRVRDAGRGGPRPRAPARPRPG